MTVYAVISSHLCKLQLCCILGLHFTFIPSILIKFLLFLLTIHLHTGNDRITEAHQRELDRILQISFNPLSATMITDMDKVCIVIVLLPYS